MLISSPSRALSALRNGELKADAAEAEQKGPEATQDVAVDQAELEAKTNEVADLAAEAAPEVVEKIEEAGENMSDAALMLAGEENAATEQQEAIDERFSELALPYGTYSLIQVTRRLDAYSEQWTQARVRACDEARSGQPLIGQ